MDTDIFADFVKGRYKTQSELQRACKGDAQLLGNVMVRVVGWRKELEMREEETKNEKVLKSPFLDTPNPWWNCWCCRRIKPKAQ